jgi:hypothetical protein
MTSFATAGTRSGRAATTSSVSKKGAF